MKKILVVAAHPDDEILGCGATVARMINNGAEAYTLILGEGVTSRDQARDRKKREKDISALRDEIHAANGIIGVRKVFIEDFPDNRFDIVPLLDLIKIIEKVKAEVTPDTIFTHFANDLNIDHKITVNAVLTATRPVPDECVKGVYSFEVLSSTEWNYPPRFSPDTFFDVSETIDNKIKAMACYKSELKNQPHPRSLEGIKLNARQWGMKTGVQFAEAFKTLRLIR